MAKSQCAMGRCYKSGLGTVKDYEQAEKWYKLAAEQGNKIAHDALLIRDGKER